jgi:uncharacterized secreted protein with C-terminal beta-propeller domain
MTTTRGTLSIGVVALFGTLGLACADHAGVGGVTPADAGNPDVAHVGNPDVANAGNPEVSPAGVITLTITAAATATATGTGTASAAQTSTTYSTATAVAAETAPDAGIGTTTAQTSTTTGTGTGTSTPTSVKTVTVTSTSTSTAGVVTSVFPRNGYNLVTIVYPAAWSCPSDTSLPSSITPQGTLPTDPSLSATDCASLANLRRPQLKAQSLTALTNTRAGLIRANCTQKTETRCLDSNGLDVSTYNCYYQYGSVDAGMVTPSGGMTTAMGGFTAMTNSGAAGASGATEYSTTNTQVASVDEADYIKNDSNTIFVLSTDGLHVIDAWPAAQTHEIAHLTLTGEPRRMYLLDNRLVVYTRVQATSTSGGAGSSNPSDQGCTYGYGCRFSSEGGHTLAVVFDVTNPASPAELVRYEMSGGYVDSRRIGSVVYSVVHDTGATQIPGLDYSLQATSYDDMQTKFNQRVADNNAKIDNTSDAYFLPWSNMTKPGGTAALSSDCQHALVAQNAQAASFVSLNAFDLTKLESPTRTVLGSSPGYVYSSATALYMAVDRSYEQDYSSGSYYYSSYQPTDSFVHKFTLNGTDTSYVGSIALPGHILNQFAMDENNGVLRVASTKGWVPDPSVASFLTTFGEQSGKLTQLGQIGGIAPQEDIRSVRFDGNRGFVVTFKKTDPLFVFDLTDPAKPQTLGELLIPGFSTYMQPLDTNHMLAIGFTADDQGSFAYFNGIQIQIFDVTDLANPKLAWKTVIGTRGSNSEALTNHLAFNYFAPKKMLALPITVCEGGGNGVYAQNLTFAGLMVFDISLDTGITEHGRLPFLDPATVSASANCGTWWTDSKSLVKRSIFMDDWIYGFSDTQLRVAALSNMSSVLQTVPLVSQ